MLDLAQPGWRDEVIAEQYGRIRVVTHGRPEVGRGLAGRPTVTIDDLPGVYVAGDWVGPDGAAERRGARPAVASPDGPRRTRSPRAEPTPAGAP